MYIYKRVRVKWPGWPAGRFEEAEAALELGGRRVKGSAPGARRGSGGGEGSSSVSGGFIFVTAPATGYSYGTEGIGSETVAGDAKWFCAAAAGVASSSEHPI